MGKKNTQKFFDQLADELKRRREVRLQSVSGFEPPGTPLKSEVKIMNKTKKKLSQVAKSTGFMGGITARFMVIGHRAIYKNVK
jgi:hypothetical protein